MSWLRATIIRAIKTGAQVALAVVGTAALVTDIDWQGLVSLVGIAMLTSVLTSLTGLPETSEPGPLEGTFRKDDGSLKFPGGN